MLRSMRPARLAATMLLAATVCACGQRDKLLDADQIEREVHALASLSAEAAFFCSEWRAGHLSASYASVHLQNLAEDAFKSQHELARQAPQSLQQQQAAAQQLAQQLTQSLGSLALAQAGPDAQVEREQQALAHLKSEFDALGKKT